MDRIQTQKDKLDLRCEFELAKYFDLAELPLQETGLIWHSSPGNSHSKDSNYEWFQETHNFKLMTREQFEVRNQQQRQMLKPKLNLSTVVQASQPLVNVARKRTMQEADIQVKPAPVEKRMKVAPPPRNQPAKVQSSAQ